MGFVHDIERFSQKTGIALDTVLRKLVLDMTTEVIMMSPVDTGRFRSNWQVSKGTINYNIDNPIDASGSYALGLVMSSLTGFKHGDVIFITNSLPYAIPLEYGHSSQAPSGMVRLTVLKYHEFLRSAVEQL